MLFDTSSPGRKRAVQVIFAALAILMGGGLVLFGIGSSQQDGGLIAIGQNQVSSAADQGKKDAESAQKALDKNPKDVAAAEKLARGRLAIATEEAFDPATGQVADEEGQGLITAADTAWTNYLKLAPEKPARATSAAFSNFYASTGQYDKAARALEANLVTREPTAGLYAQLSLYYLASGVADKAKDAKDRALALAPSEVRRQAIKKDLDKIEADVKKQQAEIAKQQKASEAGNAGGEAGTGTTPKLPTLPTLQ